MKEFEVIDRIIYIDEKSGEYSSSIKDLLNGLIDIDTYNPNFKDYSSPVVTLSINLSNACNLACKYCFNDEKDGSSLKLDDVFRFIDNSFAQFPNKEKYIIDISGKGEPLLFLDKILKIKEYTIGISNRINREILVQFVSNGVLLTPVVAEVLQKNGILFGVSVDGNKKIHDLYRKTKDGKDTYDIIMNNIKGIENRSYVGLAATLTKEVFSLKDSLIELSEVFETIGYKPSRSSDVSFTEDTVYDWLEEYEQLTIFLRDQALNNNLKYLKILLNGDDYFGKFIRRVFLHQHFFCRCDAGLARFSLDKDGSIYICPAAYNNEKYRVGDNCKIDVKKSEKLFYLHFSNEECNSCAFRYLCAKECLIELDANKGPNKIMCTFKKYLILLAIYFYLELKEKNQEAFNEILSFCKEYGNRYRRDLKLENFLKENNYPFVEGKKIYDSMK